MEEDKEKQKQCNCGVQTPEMMLWGFIGFIVGGLLGFFLFHNAWITIISIIFFSSLFTGICRRKQAKAKNN